MKYEYLEVKHSTVPSYEPSPQYVGELPPTVNYLGDKYSIEFSNQQYLPDTFEVFNRIEVIETLSELGWQLLSVVEYGVKPSLLTNPSQFTVLMYFKREVK